VTSYETDYSLNLSILLSEGKETNRDFFSSGERTRIQSDTLNQQAFEVCRIVVKHSVSLSLRHDV